jgi:hypothetical protein
VDAQVVFEPPRMTACVSRPPLSMIASMTGLLHQRYTLPWTEPIQVALFSGESE